MAAFIAHRVIIAMTTTLSALRFRLYPSREQEAKMLRARYPRFKRFSRSLSFTYPQCYNGSVKPDSLRKRLFLSKIGNVPIIFHRQLPKNSRLKTCTVIREPCGEWYASLVYEEIVPLQDVSPPRLTTTTFLHHPFMKDSLPPVGVDLGLKSLVTISHGAKVEHPKYLRNAERRLKRLQRAFSRKERGSRNRGRLATASRSSIRRSPDGELTSTTSSQLGSCATTTW